MQILEAKKRLSQVVNLARSEGPQTITLPGDLAAVSVYRTQTRKNAGGATRYALAPIAHRHCP